ncbi:MAG TPA: peptidylprolyl isomerase, partial [Solirubrobacterales bacterium]|nr:peptidylprolyl isomerase [Solirubrobacterales bacterium]
MRTTIAATLAAALLIGCGGDEEDQASVDLPPGCSEVSEPAPRKVQLPAPEEQLTGPATASVETSCGTFEIALDAERAPRTTASFAYLAREGAYDETVF